MPISKPNSNPLPNSPVYTVYILETSQHTYYTGQTNDLDRRLYQHHFTSYGAKYLHRFDSFKLVHTEYFPTRRQAMSREAAIKKLSPTQKQQLIKKSTDTLAS